MERRVGLLREGCNKTESLRRKFNSRAFYALPVSSLLPSWPLTSSSQDRSLVWCPVFKAASTNWMHHLLQLAGRNQFEIQQILEEHPKQPNEQARVVAPVLGGAKLKLVAHSDNATNLIIVRHPFDRSSRIILGKTVLSFSLCSGSSRPSETNWSDVPAWAVTSRLTGKWQYVDISQEMQNISVYLSHTFHPALSTPN